MTQIHCFNKDQLLVKIFKDKETMANKAANEVSKQLKNIISQKKEATMVFAAAPSQNEFLYELTKKKDIDWKKVIALHLDEYIGLKDNLPQKFKTYLKENLFNKVKFREVRFIDQQGQSPEEEVEKYSKMLKKHPIDIACIGIGENGHIAFNDPHVADFADPENIKLVNLDKQCRQQQVNDGCFKTFEEVPKQAITMTIPSIMAANYIFCVVPNKNKSRAVYDCIKGKIDVSCPASVLRSHQRAILYLDKEAATLLDNKA